jgi:hypothetical protein
MRQAMTRTAKLSTAQQKIVDRIGSGEALKFDQRTGRYVFTNSGGAEKDVDQRPVLVMIRDRVLRQDMTGHCYVE